MFLALAVAVAYLSAKPQVFRSTVTIQIGQVGGAGFFEAPEVVAARLMAEHGEKRADDGQREHPFLVRASADKNAPGIVSLAAEALRPGEVAAFLEGLVDDLRKRHAEILARNVRFLEEHMTRLESQRAELLRQYEDSARFLTSTKGDLPMQAALIAIELGRISDTISRLDAEKPRLAQKLSPPETQATTLLGKIQVPARPHSAAKWLVAVAAAVAGLLAGAMLVFVVEFAPRRSGSPPGARA